MQFKVRPHALAPAGECTSRNHTWECRVDLFRTLTGDLELASDSEPKTDQGPPHISHLVTLWCRNPHIYPQPVHVRIGIIGAEDDDNHICEDQHPCTYTRTASHCHKQRRIMSLQALLPQPDVASPWSTEKRCNTGQRTTSGLLKCMEALANGRMRCKKMAGLEKCIGGVEKASRPLHSVSRRKFQLTVHNVLLQTFLPMRL